MPQLTPAQIFELAQRHHVAGRLAEAETLYRQILAQIPDQPDALHFLGVLAQQVGKRDLAVDLIRRALAVKPDYPDALSNLGNILRELRRIDDAVAAYRRALALNPRLAGTHYNLSLALRDRGQLDAAIASCRQALTLQPQFPEACCALANFLKEQGRFDEAFAAYHHAIAMKPDFAHGYFNLGVALGERGRRDDALAAFQEAVSLQPDFAEAIFNLGGALHANHRIDESIAAFRRAIAVRPAYAEAYSGLGNALKEAGQLEPAIAAYRQALAINPDFAEAHNNLGNTLKEKGLLEEELACYQKALALNPNLPIVYCNLGNALKEKGRLDDALAAYRRAIALDPQYTDAHSNLVFTMHYHPSCSARAIADEARAWNRHHAQPLQPFITPHANGRDPHRRLRIGYVSPDLREHPVGRFMLPLLDNHDKTQVEVFAYAQLPASDATTGRLRGHTDAWRLLAGLSPAQSADLIRADRIDILVDLALHTARDQLLIFARKPAPIQVAYLGYVGTTGLDAIDYRFTDAHLDPPGGDPAIYSETSIHLPGTYWCYPGFTDAPPVNLLPADAAGHITFGCFNNFCKINDGTVNAWSRLLAQVPRSRLHLHAYEGDHRQRIFQAFARAGIDPARITFIGRTSFAQYFTHYSAIDIALDTFPYGGGTTTCDALWMGVPVVSLIGNTAVGRGGLSILSNVGLPELAASSEDQYVRIASDLAADIPRLREWRATLRSRLQNSSLMDAPRFARDIEAAYRRIWQKWCADHS